MKSNNHVFVNFIIQDEGELKWTVLYSNFNAENMLFILYIWDFDIICMQKGAFVFHNKNIEWQMFLL